VALGSLLAPSCAPPAAPHLHASLLSFPPWGHYAKCGPNALNPCVAVQTNHAQKSCPPNGPVPQYTGGQYAVLSWPLLRQTQYGVATNRWGSLSSRCSRAALAHALVKQLPYVNRAR